MIADSKDRISKVPEQKRRTRLVLKRLGEEELEREDFSEILSDGLKKTRQCRYSGKNLLVKSRIRRKQRWYLQRDQVHKRCGGTGL